QHLAMIFAVAKLAGWLKPPARAEHVSFGPMLGSDGKMFRTRAGASAKLSDLLDEAVERARGVVAEKNPELDAETRADVARMLGFEGNTGPYMQYAHARIRSIFRRGDVSSAPPQAIVVAAPAERVLALALLKFPTALASVSEDLEPHVLCTFLYDLATSFSS